MKTSVSICGFDRAFIDHGRQDQFSPRGRRALFEYLEEYEDSTDTELELDVIALCCDYSEYASAKEAAMEYGMTAEDDEDTQDEEALEEHALDWLRDRTQVIEYDGGVIVQSF